MKSHFNGARSKRRTGSCFESTWFFVVMLVMLMCLVPACQPAATNEVEVSKHDQASQTLVRQEKVVKGDANPDASITSSQNDWPCFLGLGQDGVSSETGITTDWSDDNLPLLWTRKLGEGYAPGVVSNGKYFHFDRVGDEARLVCLNAQTGDEIWDFKYFCSYRDLYGYDGGPRSSPTVDGDLVFVFGVEGVLHAINVDDGEEVWKVDVNERFGVHQNFFGAGTPPVVFQDKVLLIVGGSPEDNKIRLGQLDSALPNSSAIVAFDKETGEEVYSIGEDLASYSTIRLTNLEGDDWAFAWCRENLIAFDPNQGDVLFTFPWRAKTFESVNASTPVVVDNQILLSECYGVGSVLLEFGKDIPDKHRVVWKDQGRDMALKTHWNTPVFHDGHLYASSGRHSADATLRCVEFATGEVKWSKPGLTRCNLTLVDGHLVVVGERGGMLLIKASREEFELVSTAEGGSEFKRKYPCWAAPVIANGLMYVRSGNQVACFELIPGSAADATKE